VPWLPTPDCLSAIGKNKFLNKKRIVINLLYYHPVMIRTIFLLSPIFVTLLWSITLAGNAKRYSNPRLYLGRFMLLPLIIYISHFLYFVPYPAIYPYFDVISQSASLLVFPAYYVYFRLLTVDDNFSFRSHARFFIVPIVVSILYAVGVFLTPQIEYRTWLFDPNAYSQSPSIKSLAILRSVIRIVYLIQVMVTVAGNYWLIKKYADRAEQFYSDMQDGKYNNAKRLNYSIIVMGVAAIVFTILGRRFLTHQDALISVGWAVFSAMLFIIGYLGIKQKPINPSFELSDEQATAEQLPELTLTAEKSVLESLILQFEQNKMYLNNDLNIMDVVQVIGTNRTYVSALINQHYNQNFCSYVNSFRVEALKEVVLTNPTCAYEVLAESCGFGSVSSMKRAVTSSTGLSISEWKKTLIAQ